MGYVAILLIAVLVYFTAVRLGAFALQLTGIEPDVARFQSLSALTGTGFTTTEAERVIRHRSRRRIITILIIIGNCSLITIVGALVVSFAQVTGYVHFLVRLAVIGAGFVIIYKIVGASSIGNRVLNWFREPIRRYIIGNSPEIDDIFQFEQGWGVRLVTARGNTKCAGTTVSQIEQEYEVKVLAINRNGQGICRPQASEVVREGDQLLVYGKRDSVCQLLE